MKIPNVINFITNDLQMCRGYCSFAWGWYESMSSPQAMGWIEIQTHTIALVGNQSIGRKKRQAAGGNLLPTHSWIESHMTAQLCITNGTWLTDNLIRMAEENEKSNCR